MTLSSAAHIRTITVVGAPLSPSSTSSTLSSANSSLQSSPSTSMCHSDMDSDLDVSVGGVANSSHGDLNVVMEGNSNSEGAASKRMVQKKMTGKCSLFILWVTMGEDIQLLTRE